MRPSKELRPKQKRRDTMAEELGAWASEAEFSRLTPSVTRALKLHILDSLGCAIGALSGAPIRTVRAQVTEFGGKPLCTRIGGEKTAPDHAAFHNGALVRYLDFMDNYMGKHQTCHPSDNLAGILAAAEYANGDGRDLLVSLAVAYQVQSRLCDVAPIQEKGFDHTTQLGYSLAAGMSRALGLKKERAAHAIAIAGASLNPLWVTRTGYLSNWKGLASAAVAHSVTSTTFLAMRGITGPLEVFEGHKGFMEAIAGKFNIDWRREDLEIVTKSSIKAFNAEVHTQSLLEATLELRARHDIDPKTIDRVQIEIFKQAYRIVGGSREGGDKKIVESKEQADHSIPYLVAVALLDGEVNPRQFAPARIRRRVVQNLLRRVEDRPKYSYTHAYPEQMRCRITVHLRNGERLTAEKQDYEGFFTRPMPWEVAVQKFDRLTRPFASPSLQSEIVDAVAHLESIHVSELMKLLARTRPRQKR
jgi:2-methylcitrate dehydratase